MLHVDRKRFRPGHYYIRGFFPCPSPIPPIMAAAADDSFNGKLLGSGPLFNHDKFKEKGANESVEATSDLPGDVYEDNRAIDLGADGKERPIGRSTTFVEKSFLPFAQRPTSTLPHV